jgi:cell division protein FtsN
MYCPKCTLEIKGEDQETCPICSEPLIESPVEKTEEPTAEDLKLQELIADIDSSVSVSEDAPFSQETLDSEAEEVSGTEPDFKLEMDDKLADDEPESDSEPDIIPLASEEDKASILDDDISVDLEKEFSLDDEMTDGEISSDQVEDNFYDLEKELGLVDEKMKAVEAEPPTIDFDKFALTEEEKSFALDDAVEEEESGDAAETDSKEVLQKTLEELDPIKDMDQSQKKSSGFGLIAVIVILIAVCGIVYTKFKPEIESLIKPDAAKIVEDEKLKERFAPKADKQVEEAVVKEPVVEAVEKPVEQSVELPIEIIAEKPVEVAVEKPVEEVAPPKPVKEEVVAPVKPSVTYSIHAGSFRKTEFAQKDVDRFSKLGFNAYIERVDLVDKGIWYRVKIGLYNTRAEALSAEKEFLKKVKAQTRVIRNK